MVRLGNRTYRLGNKTNPVNWVLFPIQTVGAISESRPLGSQESEFPPTDSTVPLAWFLPCLFYHGIIL